MSKIKSKESYDLEAFDALHTPTADDAKSLQTTANALMPGQMQAMVNASLLNKSDAVNEATKLKSVFIDPYNLLDFMGSRSKPSRVTWQILRRMSLSCKPVAAVIQTRQNQVASFTQIPRRTGDVGFRITTRDPHKRPSVGELERIKELTWWFSNMGYDQFDEHLYTGERKRDGFDSFMRKAVRDSLTLDAVCFEIQRNALGKPHGIWPVDPSTIKMAAEVYEWEPRSGRPIPIAVEKTNGLPIRYVQELYGGQRVALFNEKELVYGVRNPRTDIDSGGYGLSELEILMETVTQVLFTEQYNAKYFTQNALPQGVLNIAGKYTSEALESFKRQWVAQVSGTANAWKIPIMAIDEAQGGVTFTPFKESNRNMQYNLWLEYLIQTVCSVYTIDPSEIGFQIGSSGGSPMVEHSGAVKIDFSKDKGLRPLLKFFAHLFNENIVKEIYPDLFFEWVGIDAMSEADKVELTTKKITNGTLTVNEARAMDDMPPIVANWANAPGNATLMQVYVADLTYQREQEAAQKEQEAQMAQMGAGMPPAGEEGAEGAEGAEGEEAPPAGEQPPGGVEAPALPGSDGEAPVDQREPNPADLGIEMPIDTTSKKDETSQENVADREAAKKKKAQKREKDVHGVSVNKSFSEEEDIVEVVIE